MSLEDLERAGITLPQEQWGKRQTRSTVHKPLFLAAAILAVVAAFLMYWGNGRWVTWLAAILFLVALFGATALCLHATEIQGRKEH
jgi:hypothetical protein